MNNKIIAHTEVITIPFIKLFNTDWEMVLVKLLTIIVLTLKPLEVMV